MKINEIFSESQHNTQAVSQLKSALLARKQKLQSVTDDQVYDIIDKIMTRIAKAHDITGKQLHDLWVAEYNQVPDTWIMKEAQEKFNQAVMQPGFEFSQEIDGVTYEVTNDRGQGPVVTVTDKNNEVIAQAGFEKHKTRPGLESINTYVEPAWQGQGIAANMYAVIRMLGANISPSTNQTDDGQSMWDKWDKQGDTKHIKSLNSKFAKKGIAENFADGRNPQDKGDAKRHGVNTKASVSSLRKTAKQGGRKGQLAHWMANMKAGKAKKK